MKKFILFIGLFLITSLTSLYGQLTIDQTVTPNGPYKVGDTITVTYNVNKLSSKPRYIWLRYHYDNKAIVMVPNSTSFGQGSSTQTYYTHWNNYLFTPNSNKSTTSLYDQYLASPWNYSANPDFNVGQITLQKTGSNVDGVLATQKYIIKDKVSYNDIHVLDLAYAIDDASLNIDPINTTIGKITLTSVSGNTSQFKVKVLFPQGYPITDHNVQLMKLKTDGTIDWSTPPIATSPLDASGEALFTTQVKVGDSVGVFVGAAFQKGWMNDIVTVTDAYRAFLGHSQTDINGNSTFFTYPILEKRIGNITKEDTVFNESDSYYMFAHIMGINVDDKAFIPKSTSTNVRWYSGLLNQSWLDGVIKNKVTITSANQTVYAVFAWGGDMDWSHSSSPTAIASSIGNGVQTNSTTTLNTMKTMSVGTLSYTQQAKESASLSVTSTLQNDQVVLTTTLSKEGLAGLEVIMNYDNSKLKLENVIFDTGNTVTNFSTDNNGHLTFGSIDQLKTSRIKIGTPYKLIFSTKTPLTNTSGLFYFVLADAVNGNGDKIELRID